MDGFFVGGLHNFFPEEGHSDEGDDQEIIESNEGALFSDESSCGSINTRYEDTMWEDFIVWDGYNVYAYCARLKKNDPALKEKSESQKEFSFGTDSTKSSLTRRGVNRDRALQFFNRLLPVLVSGSNSVRTLTGVPLCEGTAIVLSRELERRPDFLRNLAIDIVRESLDDNHTPTVGEHHAPRFARALKNMQKLECLSINFSEVYYFSTGEAYFRALSGSFPVSLRQLELNNVGPLLLGISTTISSVIEQSGLNLDSFIFANCKFGDIFPSVIRSLRTKRTTLRVLHFDDLNELTTPRLSDFLTRHEFPCSKELGIGITARVNILTDFCMSLGEHEGIEEIDLVDGPKDWMECKRDTLSLFEALAIMIKKLPNLRSISTSDMGHDGLNFKPFKCPPSAFMEAVEKHSHLTKLSYALLRMMTPSARHKFEYFALSNQYKDHLTGSKFQVFEAFEKISKKAQFGANVVTLAFETIRRRDDLLRDDVPLKHVAKKLRTCDETTLHRFSPGPVRS